jgi:hypothetical protein
MINYDYETAKTGGSHKGFFQQCKEKRVEEIQKSIRSLGEQIATHKDKIANPDDYINKILEGILEERKQ